MSTAMRLYLQRKREHDMFIAKEEAEFEMGKQHLANMMGLDHQSMTQVQLKGDNTVFYSWGTNNPPRPYFCFFVFFLLILDPLGGPNLKYA